MTKLPTLLLPLMFAVSPALPSGPDSQIIPQLSPRASVSQTIGTTVVSLEYHRPQVKGRTIWGGLVPYGEIWRTGANEATTIRFSDTVKVEGNPVPAGTYSLFTIPGPDKWTFILNKRWKQFGAFEYNPKEDVLRVDVKPRVVPMNECLSFEIYPASRSSAYVDLYWEKLRVSLFVEVDVDAIVMARLKRAMTKASGSDWKIYADGAEYLLDIEKDLAQALDWVDTSVKIKENPTNLFVKAKIQKSLGQAQQAQQTLERALGIAQARKAGPVVIAPMQLLLDQWKQPATAGNGASGNR